LKFAGLKSSLRFACNVIGFVTVVTRLNTGPEFSSN
jgi:hypothetical protein